MAGYKNLLQNQKACDFETWQEASELYKICINHDPGMILTYFMARSIKVANALNGDTVKMSLERQNLQ